LTLGSLVLSQQIIGDILQKLQKSPPLKLFLLDLEAILLGPIQFIPLIIEIVSI